MEHELLKALGQTRPVFWYASDKKNQSPFEILTEPDIDWAKKKGMGVFFTVNEAGETKNDRGNLRHAENILRPLACFVDFDHGTLEEQTAKLFESPLAPSAYVKSGRGYHAYWILRDTKETDLAAWGEVQKRIAQFFKADEAVSDPARLMRLPGSWHTKGDPKPVILEYLNPELTYTLKELSDAFPASTVFVLSGQAVLNRVLEEMTVEGSRNTNAAKVAGKLLGRFKQGEWESSVWPLLKSWNTSMCNPPDDEDKLRGTFESISRAELAKRKVLEKGVSVFGQDDFVPQVQPGDNSVTITIPTEDGTARFSFTDIEQSGTKEIDALLAVDFLTPGSYPKPFTSRINIVSLTTRATFARELGSLGKGLEWRLLLNTACEAVIAFLANRDTSIDLSRVPSEQAPTLFHPFLAKNTANLLFGDGGTGKTFLCLRMAISLATGVPFLGYRPQELVNTLFVDYEDTEQTASHRLTKLCRDPRLALNPTDILRKVRYFNPGGSPLHTVIPALRKIIQEHQIGLILIDSVASACGNEPEKAESAARYYNALRVLGITSLSIAHVSKSTTGGDQNYAFGSIFWHNLARNTWNVKGEEEVPEDELAELAGEPAKQLGLFHRKCNNGPKQRPIPLRIVYGTDDVRFDQGNLGFWEQGLPTAQRVLRLIRSKPMTRGEIEDALSDTDKNTIKQALHRLKAQGAIELEGGQGGAWKRKPRESP